MVPYEPRTTTTHRLIYFARLMSCPGDFWIEASDAQNLTGERFHTKLFRQIAKQYYDLLSSETSHDVIEAFVKEQQAKARKTVLVRF